MPYIKNTDYKPHHLFRNKHFNTLYRYIKSQKKIAYKRERIRTPDSDFIDLDFSNIGAHKVIIAIHGLEGSSNSGYIRSLSYVANQRGYDIVVFNLRGCSGEPNKTLASYHSGKTQDLAEVIKYIEKKQTYTEIYITGFSLGGNLAIKYMGEFAAEIPEAIKAAVAVSAPCDLEGSAHKLTRWSNTLYQNNFLKTLKTKALKKIEKFPGVISNLSALKNAKTLIDFDTYFTAPANGFDNAMDYYRKSSSKQFIKYINKPVLLIAALDDPFLSKSCYPFEEAQVSKQFYLHTTKYGGHIGFLSDFSNKKQYWLPHKIIDFFDHKTLR